ncbi:MAG: Inorganic pyrophosphatase [Allobaculum sp.]
MKGKENELENNVYFWQKLDMLILSGKLEIIRAKGQPSLDYPGLIYPIDFGTIKDAISAPSTPLYCFRGSLKNLQATAIVIQADILAREVITKVLIGCTPEECETILKFISATEFQKAIMVRRSSTVPTWADTDQ